MKNNRDFDKVIDRKNTGSFKWYSENHGLEEDKIIPMWVADMDFRCAEPIVNAVVKRAEHGIYGYPIRDDDHGQCFIEWQKKRFGCEPKLEWISYAPPGVIFAVDIMLDILTKKGDKVLLLMPNYDPLFEMIPKSGRELVESQLIIGEDGLVTIDFDDLESKLKMGDIKMMTISNPHNPSGRVWSREELGKIAELTEKYNVFVVSDEIHADFIAKEKGHVPYYSISESAAKNSMSCYSANKGFNLGGFQTSTLIIADEDKKAKFDEQIVISQTRLDNIFGSIATKVAYTDPECEAWIDDAIEYVEGNKQYMYNFFKENIPQIKAIPSEGTYLVWVDCSGIGYTTGKQLEDFFLNKAKVEPCMGYEFGKAGELFVRMNLACPRTILEMALNRIKNAVMEKEK